VTWPAGDPGLEPGDCAEMLSAQLQSEVWELVGSVQDGDAQPVPHLLEVASFLVGLWEVTFSELCQLRGIGVDEAALRQFVSDQRVLCGSLAATEAAWPGATP
jgi:hypothetical protein